MPGDQKPYRVYRGGRTKGKVPLQTPPARARSRGRSSGGSTDYAGPGPVRTKRRPRWRRRLAIGAIVFVVLVVVWGVTSYLAVHSGITAANKRLPAGTTEALSGQGSLLLSSPTNILLLGTDHAQQAGHTTDNHSDSMMIIRTDPSRHRVNYLSIPRDLRVPIPGIGDAKINAAMQSGGPPLAIKTVESYTGLTINHVIIVDFAQFKDVIDAVGGITVNVPERIISKFDCPYPTNTRCAQWPGWRFSKGPQHMDGKRALIYSRVRKNSLNPADSDITRTARQQDVLQATLKKMTSLSSAVKLPFIGGDLTKPLATDLSAFQFMELGWVYKRAHALHCRLGGVVQTLPDGESVIVSEGDDKDRVILAVLGKTAPLPPRPGEGPYGAGCVTGSFSG
jgi:polyisoprenyl-teichoic acid--peptidoglycan teichoic acid transferase